MTDSAAVTTDSGASECGSLPPMALIVSDSPVDYPDVLLCRSNWCPLIGQQLYRRHFFPHAIEWPPYRHLDGRHCKRLSWGAAQRFTIQIPGTLFLFLGEQGARGTKREQG